MYARQSRVCFETCQVHTYPVACCNAVDSNKKGITRGVISVQPHPLRPSGNAALIAVGTSAGSIAVLESLGRYDAALHRPTVLYGKLSCVVIGT